MEPGFNGRAKGLTILTFRYIKVPFHIFYYYWGKENRSLYRGLCSTKEKFAKYLARIALRFH